MTSHSVPMPATARLGAVAAALWPWAALLCLLSTYVALRPLAIHVDDSYAWVNTVDTQSFAFFFHPHHLLYVPLAWRWNQVMQAVLPGVSTWGSLAALSAVLGCAGVAAIYATLRKLGARQGAAAAGAALPAFAFGYWFFSSEPEVYVPSAACALWSMYFLTVFVGAPSVRAAAWAGAAAGFAALFHQTGVFLFVPAAVVMYMTRSAVTRRAAVVLTSAFAAVVAPAYIAAAYTSLPELTLASFARWLFLFAGEGHGGFRWAALYGAPVGLLRSFVGGQAALDALRGAARADAVTVAGIASAAAAGVLALLLVAKSLRAMRGGPAGARIVSMAALAGFAVYGAFGVYFDAANFEWWTIPVTLAVLVCAPALLSGRAATRMAVLTAAALAAANLCLDFSYRRDPGNDVVLNAARTVAGNTWSGDVVVAPSYLGSVLWYENRSAEIVCPDEAARAARPNGAKRLLAALALGADRRGGRVVFAGIEGDAYCETIRDAVLGAVGAGDAETIGGMHFFTGQTGLLRRVGEVPITAVDAGAAAKALLGPDGGGPDR